jgi:hypothetical protein
MTCLMMTLVMCKAPLVGAGWGRSPANTVVANGLVGFQDFGRCFGRHGLCMDAVAIGVV